MAENKKSFVLYVDYIHTIMKLPDESAGRLLKHLFMYCNDEDPTTDDILVDLTFEPIKQQLKRDLKRWEGIKDKRSKAGQKSGESRRKKAEQKGTNRTSVPFVEQSGTKRTVTDTVTVTVNDTDNVTYLKEKIEKYLIDSFTWKGAVIRNLKAKGITLKDPNALNEWIEMFCTELEATEDVYKTDREAKSHFSRWVAKKLKETKNQNSKEITTRYEKTLDHNKDTAEELGLD
jgi:hypothetical protein